MIETFTALLFAHVVADFLLQTRWMIARKSHPGVLMLHGALVLLTAQVALGLWDAPELLILAAAHLVIDAVKTWGRFRGIGGFLADQGTHMLTLVALAAWAPGLWAQGAWAAAPALPALMALTAGALLAIRAGEFAVALLMKPHATRIRNNGLRNGGRQIGVLERGLIFALILLHQPIGVGFLIGAKSILRFGTASRDQRTAEYVIIGTLASFGWAILISYATLGLFSLLPPLEIAPLLPQYRIQ